MAIFIRFYNHSIRYISFHRQAYLGVNRISSLRRFQYWIFLEYFSTNWIKNIFLAITNSPRIIFTDIFPCPSKNLTNYFLLTENIRETRVYFQLNEVRYCRLSIIQIFNFIHVHFRHGARTKISVINPESVGVFESIQQIGPKFSRKQSIKQRPTSACTHTCFYGKILPFARIFYSRNPIRKFSGHADPFSLYDTGNN